MIFCFCLHIPDGGRRPFSTPEQWAPWAWAWAADKHYRVYETTKGCLRKETSSDSEALVISGFVSLREDDSLVETRRD